MNNQEMQGRQWWVERWIDLLQSYRFKKRLERAREYARLGNVLSIKFEGATVLARVKGQEQPEYNASLWLDPFSDEQWDYVIETLSQKAIFSAQLLAGEMPQNIEEVFNANGLSVFPFTLSDIHSKCSCPDPANPCKHIGAVYYELGDRFSEDPFVLFQLRGRTKEQILDSLRQLRSNNTSIETNASNLIETETPETNTAQTTENQNFKIEEFWQYNEPLDSSLVVITPSSDTILDILGPIPLPSRSESSDPKKVMQYLDQVYKAVSQQAVLTAMNIGEN